MINIAIFHRNTIIDDEILPYFIEILKIPHNIKIFY